MPPLVRSCPGVEKFPDNQRSAELRWINSARLLGANRIVARPLFVKLNKSDRERWRLPASTVVSARMPPIALSLSYAAASCLGNHLFAPGPE
jgi:hypothetical protein